MKYKIIKGTFHVVGYHSGGDSIRFKAIDDKNWEFFTWRSAATKKKQLRFEAIDTLETHYKGSHQPHSAGIAALVDLLQLIGIRDVVFTLSFSRVYSAQDGVEGFIASRALDLYDRPVSLVFGHDVQLNDGDEVSLADLPLEQCVNVKLAQMGLAYPTFYSTMEDDLLDLFTDIIAASRKNRVGLWQLDQTREFTLWDASTIIEDTVIFPKLFRRLISFFDSRSDFAHLVSYLSSQEDSVLVRSASQKAELADLLVIEDTHVRSLYDLEDLIFEPKGR